MKRLTVWIAGRHHASDCYNVVGRTRRHALEQCAERSASYAATAAAAHLVWEKPVKRVIEYEDAFDLFCIVTGEGGGRYA